jgi:hypothetical protein
MVFTSSLLNALTMKISPSSLIFLQACLVGLSAAFVLPSPSMARRHSPGKLYESTKPNDNDSDEIVGVALSEVLAEARKNIKQQHLLSPSTTTKIDDSSSSSSSSSSSKANTHPAPAIPNHTFVNAQDKETDSNWREIVQLATDLERTKDNMDPNNLTKEALDEYLASATALAMLGVAVGSPLVVGAALGYAGANFLQGETGERAITMLKNAQNGIRGTLKDVVDFTQSQLEDDEEISVLPRKFWAMAQARAEQDLKKAKQTDVKDILKSIQTTLTSEQVQKAPTRAVDSVKTFFVESEQQLQKVSSHHAKVRENFVKNIQDTLEIGSIKSAKSRAHETFKEVVERQKKKPTP